MEDYRTTDYSRTTITELMIPSYANFGGKIHGGIILSLMDKVAYACSAKHSAGYCVTASVNVVDFLAPVEVGNLVSLHASVNYAGNTSMVVGVKVVSEDVTTGKITHTNSSYFSMVAMDEDRKPKKIPGLILESRDDVRRFIEAIKRRQLIFSYKEEFDHVITDMELKAGIEELSNQRCKIKYKNE